MSIEKKSLINNMTATRKALIATTPASPVVASKVASKGGNFGGASLSKTLSKGHGASLSKTLSKGHGASLSKTLSKGHGASLSKTLSKSHGASLSKSWK